MSQPTLTYEEELRHNLSLSRTILHQTSRRRLLLSRSYTVALRATLALTKSIPYFRRFAKHGRHLTAIAMLDASLRLARSRAYKKTLSLPIAQDVYAMLSHFLGLSEVDKGDLEIVWVTDGQPTKKGVLGKRKEKRWFGSSTSFIENWEGKQGEQLFATRTFSQSARKGRCSLRAELEKRVDGEGEREGEGWNRGRSASCVGEYFPK